MSDVRLVAVALALVAAVSFGAARMPVGVMPGRPSLLVLAATHMPKRGPSRDRSLPGKARRRARRAGR